MSTFALRCHAFCVATYSVLIRVFVHSMTGLIDYIKSSTAHQHQKGHTVPKQVSPLDDDDDMTESTRKKVLWFYSPRTALRTALCESIRYQVKSEQNVPQELDLIPKGATGRLLSCTPIR